MKKYTIILAVLVVIVVGAVFNHNRDDSSIKIAFVSSLSGDAAGWGENLKAGFDYALEEINSSGGIDGRLVEAVYADDKCEAATGVSVFNKVINLDKGRIVVGTVCSSVAMSVAKTVQDNEVLYIASGATNPDVPKQGDFIFRLWVSDAYEAKAIAEYAVNTLKSKTFGVAVVNDNPAGASLKANFENKVKEFGGKVVSEGTYSSKEKDFKTVLAKLISQNPDSLYLMALPEQTPAIINQARDLGYKGNILGYSPSLLAPEVGSQIQNKENIYFSTPVTKKETDFWKNYEVKTGKEADSLVALGYDSMKVLVPALEKCGENTKCLRDSLLKTQDYQSPRGKISFDSDGDLTAVEFETIKVQ